MPPPNKNRFIAPVHYEVLQTLILSPSCPRSVLVLCSTQIGILVSDRKRQVPATATAPSTVAMGSTAPSSFNVSAVKQAIGQALWDLTDGGGKFVCFFLLLLHKTFCFRVVGADPQRTDVSISDN